MTNLDSVLKSRDITLTTKVCLVKAMVFPVVTYRCESWSIKKAECQRTDAFELWCWRRLLRVPWRAWRWNLLILKEINPEYSLGWTDAKAEAPIIWPPDAKSWLTGKDWCWERLRAEGEGGDKGWDGWMALQLKCAWIWANSGRQRRTEEPGVLQSMELQRVGHNWATEPRQKGK